ncbi:hypothetical protein [Mesobacillus maritimus]|uniref:hypothetical protein n=1 Tax=Mesobacillus maritimus TaxID=1643336 RepID=UPI00384C96AB
MFRRRFLVNILIWILAFFFGYSVKREGESVNLLKTDARMVLDIDGKNISDKIRNINEQLAQRVQFETITFNIPTDFPNLQKAITKLSEKKVKHGVTILLNIESGYQIKEALSLRNGDYSHFRIVSTDNEVLLSETFPKVIFAKFNNCRAPILATIINGQGKCTNGWYLDNGSTGHVEAGCGFTHAGTTNLYVTGGSVVHAEGGIFTDASQDGSSESGGAGIFAWGGQVFAEGSDVSNSLTYGVQGAHGGKVSFRGGIANNCGRHGIRGTNSGIVDGRGAQVNDCGVYGVYSLSGSVVNAYSVSAKNCGTAGLFASQLGTINGREAIVDGSEIGVKADRGSSVEFYMGSAIGCISRGIEVTSGSRVDANMSTVTGTVTAKVGHGVVCDYGSHVNVSNATVSGSGGKDLFINHGSTITAHICNTTNSTANKPIESDTNVTTFNEPFSYFGIIWASDV